MQFLTFVVFVAMLIAATSGHPKTREQAKQEMAKQTVVSKPKYEYKYGVKDEVTGDIKQQWEYRDGDMVKGGYSFKEADGFIRVVEYWVDGQSGYNAVVRRIDPSKYPPSTHRHHPNEHIAFMGHHIQHDALGRARSYVNVVRNQ